MSKMLFNRNPVMVGESIPEPSQDAIENTFNLRQVSLEDAARYGGSVTREALGAMKFVGDRKYIIVDTKVHFLLPGMCPSIPGWHNDGVPRGNDLLPQDTGAPMPHAMEHRALMGITEPRYHLLVTGTHCPTRFLDHEIEIKLPADSRKLYEEMSKQVQSHVDEYFNNKGLDCTFVSPASTVLTWDWWTVHTAQLATGRGWRYLIRVTETDYIPPRTNPSDFIRTQNNVYSPIEFGW